MLLVVIPVMAIITTVRIIQDDGADGDYGFNDSDEPSASHDSGDITDS